MGLDFLRNNGARRVRDFDAQPTLLNEGIPLAEQQDEPVDLEYEKSLVDWEPISVTANGQVDDADNGRTYQAHWPQRFIDGKDVGRTVAWLLSREGYPVPVRLAEIGAVSMRAIKTPTGERTLRREWDKVERVVTFMTDLFPWEEVEEFACSLQGTGFRLLSVRVTLESDAEGFRFDYQRMAQNAINRSKDEMIRLEREALAVSRDVPTIVDGGLEARSGVFNETSAVVGLIKSHSRNYLHPDGWRTFYALEPYERTPAFMLKNTLSASLPSGRKLEVVSWYLRLDGARGELPNWGIVRVEVSRPFFEQTLQGDVGYINRVSRLICDYRCRDEGYSRAAVSIHPIQRAEASLGSLFTQPDTLISHFYRLTNL
ncbi:MAG: hypothetical protein JOZ57_11000 [Abitibacteriaceae bacterium]|nr:hypothetical protein [Abditibacteriaceae bacterium]